eukprot:scaffold7704_cov112-Isochrysis_galbana.AAC.6
MSGPRRDPLFGTVARPALVGSGQGSAGTGQNNRTRPHGTAARPPLRRGSPLPRPPVADPPAAAPKLGFRSVPSGYPIPVQRHSEPQQATRPLRGEGCSHVSAPHRRKTKPTSLSATPQAHK